MITKTYTIEDVRVAIEHIDDMLRSIGFAANAGACQCGRCTHKERTNGAPAPVTHASDAPTGPGGTLVARPASAPRTPRPGGNAVCVSVPAFDDIAF